MDGGGSLGGIGIVGMGSGRASSAWAPSAAIKANPCKAIHPLQEVRKVVVPSSRSSSKGRPYG